MVIQRFSLIFSILASSCVFANDLENIEIRNELSQCVILKNLSFSKENKIPVFNFDLDLNKYISECGCKSALGFYSVYAFDENRESYLMGGKVRFLTSSHKSIPISAEKNIIGGRKLVVEFTCARPD